MNLEIAKRAVAAMSLAVVCTHSAAARDELEPVAVSISKIEIEYACGPTPGPDQPPPQCPSDSRLKLFYVGDGCEANDLVLQVRQRSDVQLLKFFKRASATDCVIALRGGSPAQFSRMTFFTSLIDPKKQVRLANPLPFRGVARP